MPTSVRLDAETEGLLRRYAAATGRTRSDILREAVTRYVQEVNPPADDTVYDRISDLVGIERGGDPTLSERTGEAFRNKLRKRNAV